MANMVNYIHIIPQLKKKKTFGKESLMHTVLQILLGHITMGLGARTVAY